VGEKEGGSTTVALWGLLWIKLVLPLA